MPASATGRRERRGGGSGRETSRRAGVFGVGRDAFEGEAAGALGDTVAVSGGGAEAGRGLTSSA
ncbi:MAG: hypothetical protein A2V74_02035 [Acidobacteria bacterium RBG_16_70_10]|nr:MAG: hypothetical protein A2V74_02035 [Acidobacteria bacterium RBG_16_70_10]